MKVTPGLGVIYVISKDQQAVLCQVRFEKVEQYIDKIS